MRAELNTRGQLEMVQTAQNSMFIWYEFPEAILEYAFNKIIVTLSPSHLLFIQDWIPVRHLKQEVFNIR